MDHEELTKYLGRVTPGNPVSIDVLIDKNLPEKTIRAIREELGRYAKIDMDFADRDVLYLLGLRFEDPTKVREFLERVDPNAPEERRLRIRYDRPHSEPQAASTYNKI